jgi:ASC-1-like (ASCH) protein
MTKARNNNNRFKKVVTEVTEIKKFASFKDMLYEEGIDNVLPGFPNVKCGVELYHKYYKPYMENKFGVVSISLKIKN